LSTVTVTVAGPAKLPVILDRLKTQPKLATNPVDDLRAEERR
jgi:hypothetical protein